MKRIVLFAACIVTFGLVGFTLGTPTATAGCGGSGSSCNGDYDCKGGNIQTYCGYGTCYRNTGICF